MPAARSRTMAAIRGSDNKTTERRLRMGFVRAGIRGWIVRANSVIGRPDFFFVDEGLAVFVDGCFWHGCPICGRVPRTNAAFWHTKFARNRERDLTTTVRLRNIGVLVIRFWEHALRDDLMGCIRAVQLVLDEKGHCTTACRAHAGEGNGGQ